MVTLQLDSSKHGCRLISNLSLIIVLIKILSTNAFAITVNEVLSIPVASANVNVFSTPIAFTNNCIYTVNVEPALGVSTGINLNTVVRQGCDVGDNEWEWKENTIESGTIDDAYHTQGSIGIDENGFIHVAYNMHNMPWQYVVSDKHDDISGFNFRGDQISVVDKLSVKFANQTFFPSIGSALIPGNQITYPAFFNDNNASLYVTYRYATKPKKKWLARGFAGGIARYNAIEKTWKAIGGDIPLTDTDADNLNGNYFTRAFAFTDTWSVYLIRVIFDNNNGMHLSWFWREGGAGRLVSHLSYAFSPNRGDNFYRSNGIEYSLPITVNNSEIITSNGQTAKYNPLSVIAVDDNLTPYVVFHEYNQTRKVLFNDKKNRKWSMPQELPNSASEFFFDNNGGKWAIASGPNIFYRDNTKLNWRLLYTGEGGLSRPKVVTIKGRNEFLLHMQASDTNEIKVFLVKY